MHLLSHREIYQRLLRYALPHWRWFALSVMAMVVYAATDTGFAALMKPMLDGSFIQRDPETIRQIPLLLIGLFIIRGISGFLSAYYLAWVGRQVVSQLRTELFAHLLHLPQAYYDRYASGIIISRLTYHVEQVSQTITSATTILVRDTLTIVGLLFWMFYLNAVLTLVFLIVGPLVAILISRVSKRFRRLSMAIQNTMGDLTQRAEEAIQGQRVIKAFAGYDYEAQQFAAANEHNLNLQLKMALMAALNTPLIQFIISTALAGIIYLATLESLRTQISVGTFMSFIAAMMLLMSPIKRLTAVNAVMQKGIAAGHSIFEFLAQPLESDQGIYALPRARGQISLRQVRFAYPAHPERLVLNNITLDIQAGQQVAFVGRSGSGKSTLLSLIPRYYESEPGQIMLDGVDIQAWTLASLRAQIAVVSQEVILFNDTVAANIAYGALRKASRAEIERAAQAAYALDFIQALPQGFDTLIGEKGSRLSGGQRQRLAIARALLKDAPVLILDEATSALDNESERYIQAALENLMATRTTLVIAHRLSTIERADWIVVMDQGAVIEQGTHAVLLAQNGHYADLYRLQSQRALT